MTKEIDFLQPGVRQIRHQIREILQSYNHDWDVIAELAQNSVDAISLRTIDLGRIKVEIIARENKIIFEDNGCGIPPNKLPNLLAPFSTAKDGEDDQIGHKGVGISFVIFSSVSFEIESHHKTGSSRASIEGASSWIESSIEDTPQLNFEKIDSHDDLGTKIIIKLPQDSQKDFFTYTFDQLMTVLLTRTAIGDTKTIWDEESNKVVEIKLRDLEGKLHEQVQPCSYLLPTTKLRKNVFISLTEFEDWNSGSRSDQQRRKKLQNKIIFDSGKKHRAGRDIRYWACFVPSRRSWDVIAKEYRLVGEEFMNLSPSERAEEFSKFDYLFTSGLYTSTKGMPTGIKLEMKARGSAGYLPNFFIILDDPALDFDIGRKSIPKRTLGMLRDIASDQFDELVRTVRKFLSGETPASDDDRNISTIFNEIRELPELGSGNTKFKKRPSGQEATIAAIFFEMLGSGIIPDICPYISGYKNKYDLYAMRNNADVVIEFKFSLEGLLRDFNDEIKMFDEIDIVVVWEVTESDLIAYHRRGITVDEIEHGLGSDSHSLFHYELNIGPVKSIKVMCLKELV